MGTYNYYSPTSIIGNIGHGIVDVFSYYLLGNTPNQINFNDATDRAFAA